MNLRLMIVLIGLFVFFAMYSASARLIAVVNITGAVLIVSQNARWTMRTVHPKAPEI